MIKKVVVAGGGVLGAQIAYQSAYCGFETIIWLRSKESIERAKVKVESIEKAYIEAINNLEKGIVIGNFPSGITDKESFNKEECLKKVANATSSLKLTTDLEGSLVDCDLVIESLTENPQDKIDFFERIKNLVPEKTLICSNSSTLLPSMFASHSGRPDKYIHLHFANDIFKNNTAEVMGHPGTSESTYQALIDFSKNIRMIPLVIRKEQPGYLVNSLFVPISFAAIDLLARDVSTPEDIDIAWEKSTGAPIGILKLLDIVGMKTLYDILLMNTQIPEERQPYPFALMVKFIKENYIDKGKMGYASGEGFFKYR